MCAAFGHCDMMLSVLLSMVLLFCVDGYSGDSWPTDNRLNMPVRGKAGNSRKVLRMEGNYGFRGRHKGRGSAFRKYS